MSPEARVDLEAYLRRIGFAGPRAASRAVLEALHECHVGAIPFENVDVRLGRRIRLDLGALQEKLVNARRGGYCFEHNTLFAAVLRELGFAVETLEARVRGGAAVRPRTHMLLSVTVDGASWLADVGFGGDGPRRALPMDGALSAQGSRAFRVAREGELGVLRSRRADEWSDLYAFAPTPALPVDFEMANHFTSTFPDSPFVKTLTAQLSRADARHVLRGRTYTVSRDSGDTTRELSAPEVAALLREVFGLELADDEVSHALGS